MTRPDLCLDFANTTSGRGTDQNLEHLLRYDDLVVWSRRTGLLSADEAAALTAQAAARPEAAGMFWLTIVGLPGMCRAR